MLAFLFQEHNHMGGKEGVNHQTYRRAASNDQYRPPWDIAGGLMAGGGLAMAPS